MFDMAQMADEKAVAIVDVAMSQESTENVVAEFVGLWAQSAENRRRLSKRMNTLMFKLKKSGEKDGERDVSLWLRVYSWAKAGAKGPLVDRDTKWMIHSLLRHRCRLRDVIDQVMKEDVVAPEEMNKYCGISAIETMGAKGIVFRSQLEARWAEFFDKLGWKWEYEPFPLKGYIPDFIVYPTGCAEQMLVEVKPEIEFELLGQHVKKIRDSGWKGAALVVGARLFETKEVDIDYNHWTNYFVGLGNVEYTWGPPQCICEDSEQGSEEEKIDIATHVCTKLDPCYENAPMYLSDDGGLVFVENDWLHDMSDSTSYDKPRCYYENKDSDARTRQFELWIEIKNRYQWKPGRKRKRS